MNNLEKDSVLLVNQIKTFDKSRIVKVLGCVDENILNEVYQKIDIHFGRS
jgi:mRNA-degrading endonuclease toxin of MazEF toxin-antitoxin module